MDNWQRSSQGRCQDGKGVYEVRVNQQPSEKKSGGENGKM